MKRAERRNRDEFRKMMEEHVAAGTLTAKTHWRDYCQKVCPRRFTICLLMGNMEVFL